MNDNQLKHELYVNVGEHKDIFSKLIWKFSNNKTKFNITDLENFKKFITNLNTSNIFSNHINNLDSYIKILRDNNLKTTDDLDFEFQKEIFNMPFHSEFNNNLYLESNLEQYMNSNDGYICFTDEYSCDDNGKLLIDFISYDVNNFEEFTLLFINFIDCFLDILTLEEKDKIESRVDLPISYIKALSKKYYKSHKDYIIEKQNIFKSIIDFVYNTDYTIDFQGLSIEHRYAIYNFTNKFETLNSFSENFTINNISANNYYNDIFLTTTFENKNLDEIITLTKKFEQDIKFQNSSFFYSTKDIYTSLYLSLYHLIGNQNIHIKKCKNCIKYFISSKKNIVYCDRIATDDNKTCKDIGNLLSQKRKEQEDYVYKLYRNTLAKKKMAAIRNKDIPSYQKEYETWKRQANIFRNNIDLEFKTNDEFREWIEQTR